MNQAQNNKNLIALFMAEVAVLNLVFRKLVDTIFRMKRDKKNVEKCQCQP